MPCRGIRLQVNECNRWRRVLFAVIARVALNTWREQKLKSFWIAMPTLACFGTSLPKKNNKQFRPPLLFAPFENTLITLILSSEKNIYFIQHVFTIAITRKILFFSVDKIKQIETCNFVNTATMKLQKCLS